MSLASMVATYVYRAGRPARTTHQAAAAARQCGKQCSWVVAVPHRLPAGGCCLVGPGGQGKGVTQAPEFMTDVFYSASDAHSHSDYIKPQPTCELGGDDGEVAGAGARQAAVGGGARLQVQYHL